MLYASEIALVKRLNQLGNLRSPQNDDLPC